MEAATADNEISRANLLTNAAALGNVAEVQMLLDEGADPNGVNSYGRTAIQSLTKSKSSTVSSRDANHVLMLNNNKTVKLPSVSVFGDGKVMKLGDPRMAELLLQRGADPNLPDPSTGTLPVHDAAREGFLDTLQVLLQGGAHIHVPDNQGRLPIDLAEESGHSHVVSDLLRLTSGNAWNGAAS